MSQTPHLYAAACRRRLGAVVGGDAGRTLQDAANHWMATQDVRNTGAFTHLITPGFPDERKPPPRPRISNRH